MDVEIGGSREETGIIFLMGKFSLKLRQTGVAQSAKSTKLPCITENSGFIFKALGDDRSRYSSN